MAKKLKPIMDAAKRRADLDFYVPLLPVSVNHYKKPRRDGGYYVTKEAMAYKGEVARFAKGQWCKHEYYAIEITVHLGHGDRLDLDNSLKVILDGLVEGGQIHSDAAVTHLALHKKRGLVGGTSITVWEGKQP